MSGAASPAPRPVSSVITSPTTTTAERVAGYAAAVRRVSWGAVFAGMFIAIVTQILLALLGVGVGILSTDPTGNAGASGKGLALGLGIWWAIASLISLFLGGWVAGRLA